jgi:hypothetical protein
VRGVDWQAAQIAAHIPDDHWHHYSAGRGAKGHRWYAWAWTRIDTHRPGHRWLLIRRNPVTGELAFYRCYAPTPAPLAALVRVAGIRWTVEESFQAAKSQVGLDHYQVRSWDGWHRHITLAMLALAFLAALAASQPASDHEHLPLDHAGDPSSAGRPHPHPTPPDRGDPALVTLATPPSGHRPPMPLPAQIPTMISKCHWSTRGGRCLHS